MQRRTLLGLAVLAGSGLASGHAKAQEQVCPEPTSGLRFELYRDESGDWRWSLISQNGNKIADSAEGYRRKIDCVNGIELVQSSFQAPILEQESE